MKVLSILLFLIYTACMHYSNYQEEVDYPEPEPVTELVGEWLTFDSSIGLHSGNIIGVQETMRFGRNNKLFIRHQSSMNIKEIEYECRYYHEDRLLIHTCDLSSSLDELDEWYWDICIEGSEEYACGELGGRHMVWHIDLIDVEYDILLDGNKMDLQLIDGFDIANNDYRQYERLIPIQYE